MTSARGSSASDHGEGPDASAARDASGRGERRASDDGSAGKAPRLSPHRELQLLNAARAGDDDALAQLLRSYQRRVYAICYRIVPHAEDARDLVQDVMVKLLEGMGSYDGRSKLSTWVIRVTMNCCLSHLRKSKLRRHASLETLQGGAEQGRIEPNWLIARSEAGRPGELATGSHVEQGEVRQAILDALARLDPEMRAVLVLRDLQDLEYQQIAEVLDLPVGTVKSRLFRAREALRLQMEQLDR